MAELPEGIIRQRPVDSFKLEVASNDICGVLNKHAMDPNMAVTCLIGTAVRILRRLLNDGVPKEKAVLLIANLVSAQWDAVDENREAPAND